MERIFRFIKLKFIIIIVVFFSYFSAICEEYDILNKNDLYEIAQTISLVYFQLYDLQWNTFRHFDKNKITKEEVPKINNEIMKSYSNILFKKIENYDFSIDTFCYSLINEKGLTLFNSYYYSKKIDNYEKLCLTKYKMAINKYGEFYKLFGFEIDDFKNLYSNYFSSINSPNEVKDLISFYIYHVCFSIGDHKIIIIDSTNRVNYSNYYTEVSLPKIIKKENEWDVSINVLFYPHATGTVELIEYNIILNEKDIKFTSKDKLIKKYKNLEDK